MKTKWIRMEEIDENRLRVQNRMVGSVGNMVGHHEIEQGSDPQYKENLFSKIFNGHIVEETD